VSRNVRSAMILILLLCLAGPVRAGIEESLAILRSSDEAAALDAAMALDPQLLTLGELRLQARILSRHPERIFVAREARQNLAFIPADCLGAVDLPRIFAAAAKMDREPDSRTFFELHRALTPEQLPPLVVAMAGSKPAARGHLISLFDSLVRSSDARRETVLRGLLWELALAEADGAGEPAPKLSDIAVELHATRLPDAFKKLVDHAWRVGAERRYLQNWLRRFSRELTPSSEDLAFLAHQVDWVEWWPNRAVFVRLIGRIGSPEAEACLKKLATRKDDEIAVFAAAELAREGEPESLLGFLEIAAPSEEARMLAFELLPDVAIKLWLAAAREGDPERRPLSLYPDELAEMESWYGVRIPTAVLDRLAEGILAAPAPLGEVLNFFVWTHPDVFTGSALDEIADRLLALDSFGEEEFFAENYRRVLAYLEVRAPDRLEEILAAWTPRLTEEQILELTGTCGLDWLQSEEDALSVRARAAGQPREVVDLLAHVWVRSEEVRKKMRAKADEDDWVGAAIVFFDAYPKEAYALGRIDDPRVVPFLRRLRDERRGRWSAVAGLALAGDEAARKEWRGLVRDGRMWILYELPEGAACLWGDPELVPLWIERIEGTCCVGNHALFAIRSTFPTVEFDDVPYSYPIIRRRIAAWFDRHRGSFRWSRILGGLVPVR